MKKNGFALFIIYNEQMNILIFIPKCLFHFYTIDLSLLLFLLKHALINYFNLIKKLIITLYLSYNFLSNISYH